VISRATLPPLNSSEQCHATWDPYGFHRVATGSYFSPVRIFDFVPPESHFKIFFGKIFTLSGSA